MPGSILALRAKFTQAGGIARAAFAEYEVFAGDEARDMEFAAQPFVDPAFRHHPGNRVVEMEYQHRIGAGLCEQFLPLVERRQPERRRIGPEMAHRMRIERGDDCRAALVLRPAHRFADDCLVAEVESVEITQREDRAVQGGRERLSVIDANHLGHGL